MTLPIKVMLVRGSSGGTPVLRLDDGTYTHDVIDPLDAAVDLSIDSSGSLTHTGDTGGSYAWISGGSPASYEVRAMATSGSVSTGTVGSWLPLSTTRSWSVERTTVGSKTVVLTVEIGLLGTSTALETASISMSATVSAD